MNTPAPSPVRSIELKQHQRALASKELRLVSRRAFFVEALVTVAALIAACAYSTYLYLANAPAAKLIFVVLLCLATVSLFVSLMLVRRYFLVRGRVFYAIADRSARWGAGPFEHLRLCERLFVSPVRFVVGFGYGATVACAPFVLSGYDQRDEQIALGAFLFFSNQLTGLTLYSLYVFLSNAGALFRKVVVSIWIPANESTRFFLGLTTRLSIAAILYVSLSMASILYSRFELGPIVLSYMAFSASVIVIVVAFPHMAVLRRLVEKKRSMLKVIASALDINANRVLAGDAGEAEMMRARNLMEFKKWVADASYFPIRLSSIRAFISVAIISLLPVGLTWVLDRLISAS